jgi:hypothetical protein
VFIEIPNFVTIIYSTSAAVRGCMECKLSLGCLDGSRA